MEKSQNDVIKIASLGHELCGENIFRRLCVIYDAIPEKLLNDRLELHVSEYVYNIYKVGLATKMGPCLPDILNFMGIKVIYSYRCKEDEVELYEVGPWEKRTLILST